MTLFILFLVFTVVPALELWMLIEIGQRFGGLETMLYVVAMGVLGAWLAPRVKRAALAWAVRRGIQVGAAVPGPRAQERQHTEKKVFTHPEA